MTTKLRVCTRAIPKTLSRGIHRVADALERYAPDWVEIVQEPTEADLVVIHTIGHGSLDLKITCDYAMIQYCLLTTEDARPEAWLPIWKKARAVWSYYDLKEYLSSRLSNAYSESIAPNIYCAPLGVDTEIFRPSTPLRKHYLIGTSGYIAETEGVLECYRASTTLGQKHFHLGPPEINLGPNCSYMLHVTDEVVADRWSQCSFVAGMRRIEGFELPALEGLMCGARPIMFDAPHYTRWFKEHAEYVPEAAPEEVYQSVLEIVSKRVRPVTLAERTQVAHQFDWKTLVTGFWEAVR
jgi:hypothetical protein